MTRDNPTNGGEGQNPTVSTPNRIASLTIGPEATDDPLTHEEQQGLALFATHGLADSASTIYATSVIGVAGEANPIVAQLLEQGWGWAAGTMLLITGLIAVVYPSIAKLDGIPQWFGSVVVGIGLVVAITNIVVGVTA